MKRPSRSVSPKAVCAPACAASVGIPKDLPAINMHTAWDAVQLYSQQRSAGQPVPEYALKMLDKSFAEMLSGRDARTVFRKMSAKQQGTRKDEQQERAMAFESLRLQRHGVSPAQSKDLVAGAYKIDVRTVERALSRWKKFCTHDGEGNKTDAWIDLYEASLKLAGHI